MMSYCTHEMGWDAVTGQWLELNIYNIRYTCNLNIHTINIIARSRGYVLLLFVMIKSPHPHEQVLHCIGQRHVHCMGIHVKQLL